ncbi:MAG: carboxypeptidase regulatory-like domain-containing protein, partial [Acidobacteria bacterium]|nr:carboxypeptidase regulatory-like domain-containing protein [Acidobacteriota bacterium]
LAADDAAGLSVLYPTADFASSTAVLSGQVTGPDGQGRRLVSVVAISPNGGVVSALTAPDGSYSIQGLPPATYIIYAHPLPPATQPGLGPADIVLPTDDTGTAFDASEPVETQFYGGGKNANFSVSVVVRAGQSSA